MNSKKTDEYYNSSAAVSQEIIGGEKNKQDGCIILANKLSPESSNLRRVTGHNGSNIANIKSLSYKNGEKLALAVGMTTNEQSISSKTNRVGGGVEVRNSLTTEVTASER